MRSRLVLLALVLVLLALGAAVTAPQARAALSAQQIDSFLLARGSPLAGEGQTFCSAGAQHGIDPAFLVAISGAETSFGQYLYSSGSQTASYNAFNWFYAQSRAASSFTSWDEAIATVAQGLAGPLYYGAGRYAVAAIAPIYCPQGTADWIANVTAFLTALGGNPNDTRWSGATTDSQGAQTSPTPSATVSPAILVVGQPVSVHPAGPLTVDQQATIDFTLTNVGGQTASWQGVTLRLVGPEGQAVVLSSSAPFTLAPQGSFTFAAPCVLPLAGSWQGWLSVETADGATLDDSRPLVVLVVKASNAGGLRPGAGAAELRPDLPSVSSAVPTTSTSHHDMCAGPSCCTCAGHRRRADRCLPCTSRRGRKVRPSFAGSR